VAIDVNQHPPAGHWRAVEQIGVIDDHRRGKDLGLCRPRARGGEDERARLSDAIRRCSRGASAQRLVIPAAARTVRVDRLRGPFRARLLLGHTLCRRLNVGRYKRKRYH
jgi:hypothetical protein